MVKIDPCNVVVTYIDTQYELPSQFTVEGAKIKDWAEFIYEREPPKEFLEKAARVYAQQINEPIVSNRDLEEKMQIIHQCFEFVVFKPSKTDPKKIKAKDWFINRGVVLTIAYIMSGIYFYFVNTQYTVWFLSIFDQAFFGGIFDEGVLQIVGLFLSVCFWWGGMILGVVFPLDGNYIILNPLNWVLVIPTIIAFYYFNKEAKWL